MAKLCISKEINAAHGKQIHGHTFTIQFIFKEKLINNMVQNIDFHVMEKTIDNVLSTLDKTYLDELIKPRATIENIAIYLLHSLKDIEALYSVIVYEGSLKYVEILKEELPEMKKC